MYEQNTADVAPYIDPTTLIKNPHEQFGALRARTPVIQLADSQFMALRAVDAVALLSDPRMRQVDGSDFVRLMGVPNGVASRLLTDFFLFSNGDTHRTKRGLFSRTFSHGRVRDMQPRIRATADRIVAELPRGQSFDFVDAIAARLPAEMIAAILGLPASHADFFRPRVYDLSRIVEPLYPHHHHDRIEAAAADLYDYVESELRARFATPKDDLLSTLVYDWWKNREMSFQSLVHQVLGLIVAGADTTRTAFAILVALLLGHQEQWAALKADTSLLPGAVAEGIRFEPSVGSVGRFATEAVEIGGVTVPAGAMVRISTISIMRDPELYANPDRFDICRTDHPKLNPAFGLGPHRCLGEILARMEMQEGLSALIAAAPDIQLESMPTMIGFGGIRQITPMITRIG
ncbi:cytochrome P450 [Hwanghaeella grinnelliae]|uniref:Cytochrome P450 n=1 Tax=Hwanghaeella grinnelliae TaxID=2500179 RepID=A0A3S2VNJ6_9PROT|nr:cytochrome P450 [Hwanghaeella grinnelliae]RVU35135.1 cytochrome P450 [Hwanghaeella grinnelliae]